MEMRRPTFQVPIGVSLVGIAVIAAIFAMVAFFSFHRITTDPGFETVIVDKPYFFGHQGVRDETQKTGAGWFWLSSQGVAVPNTPFKLDETFDDLSTSNNNFLDYNSYLTIRILNPAMLLDKYGSKWYENNIKEQYRTIVRNVVREKTFESLLTDPKTTADVETAVRKEVDKLIKETGIPVQLTDLSLGKATPNKSVIDEMNMTASQQQRKKTMEEKAKADIAEQEGRTKAENARSAAEAARAKADASYQEKMGLNPTQFVELQYINKMAEACKAGANCIIGNVGGVVSGMGSKSAK